MKTEAFKTVLPLYAEVDVAVIGAGPAGCCAALAAAENGCSTMLIEELGFAGGMATAGLVGPILGVYHWDSGKRILGGIPYRILRQMEKIGGALLQTEGMLVPFDPEVMKYVLDMQFQEAGVMPLYHTKFVTAVIDNGEISYVVIANGQGLTAVKAQVYIDCSGNGDLAAAAGVPFTTGADINGKNQPMTTVFRIGGIRTGDIRDSENPAAGYVATEIREKLKEAAARGLIPNFGGPWIMRGSTLREGEAFVNIVRQYGNPADPEEFTKCEIQGRKDMFALFNYMKKHIKSMNESYIIDSGASIGIRDSRHFNGLFTLTLDHCLGRQDFNDSIALGGHIIDIHSTGETNSQVRETIPFYEIPYRSLLAEPAGNLILAGRHISMDYTIFASARVMATCMALGQGAGTAAAIAVRNDHSPAGISLTELADTLDQAGVIRKLAQAKG